MIYGRTPFAHIKNKLKKWQAIVDESFSIPYPDIPNQHAVEVMKVRNDVSFVIFYLQLDC